MLIFLALTSGKNLDYALLEYAVQGWWPKYLVGDVTYPKNMDVEKLDIVIASYMKSLANANWVRLYYLVSMFWISRSEE